MQFISGGSGLTLGGYDGITFIVSPYGENIYGGGHFKSFEYTLGREDSFKGVFDAVASKSRVSVSFPQPGRFYFERQAPSPIC